MPAEKPDNHSAGVFISHATADSGIARKIQDKIQAHFYGTPVFVSSDKVSLPGDQNWLNRLHADLMKARTIIFVLTPHSITRPWVWFELGDCWEREKRGEISMFVARAGLAPDQVPMPFNLMQVIDLTHKDDVAKLFRELAANRNTTKAVTGTAALAKSIAKIQAERQKADKAAASAATPAGHVQETEVFNALAHLANAGYLGSDALKIVTMYDVMSAEKRSELRALLQPPRP